MPRMCGTNPKDLVCFPPSPSLGFKPPSVSTVLKVLAFAHSSPGPDLQPVCLWLIASPSSSLLCLPTHWLSPPILLETLISAALLHFLFSSSIICSSPPLVLKFTCTSTAKVTTLTLGELQLLVFSAQHQVVYKMLSDVWGDPAHYTLQY